MIPIFLLPGLQLENVAQAVRSRRLRNARRCRAIREVGIRFRNLARETSRGIEISGTIASTESTD